MFRKCDKILPRKKNVLIAVLALALLQAGIQQLASLASLAPNTATQDNIIALPATTAAIVAPLAVPKPDPKISSATVLSQALPPPADTDAAAVIGPPSIPYSGTGKKISTTAAIVALTANFTQDIDRLCTALTSLKFLPDARNESRPL
jgi:hypothetical protein